MYVVCAKLFLYVTWRYLCIMKRTLICILYMILESHGASTFDNVIAIFKQPCTNEDFLAEVLRILKPNGLLIIYEPLSANKKPVLTHSDRISRLKLSGFKVKETEQEKLDLESKNLLLKVYSDIEEVCKVSASKPPFEVNWLLFLHVIKGTFNRNLLYRFLW